MMPEPPTPRMLREAILKLLDERGKGKTICPSEVARAVAADSARPDSTTHGWRALMQPVRYAAQQLVVEGEVIATQRGVEIHIPTAKGPMRLRRR